MERREGASQGASAHAAQQVSLDCTCSFARPWSHAPLHRSLSPTGFSAIIFRAMPRCGSPAHANRGTFPVACPWREWGNWTPATQAGLPTPRRYLR